LERDQAILRLLAEIPRVSENTVVEILLKEYIARMDRRHGKQPDESMQIEERKKSRMSITRLFELGVLRRVDDTMYSITIPIYRLWIRRYILGQDTITAELLSEIKAGREL
jgi:hypothetical protein